MAAPRRSGKSSILKYLERNPRNGYLVKYKSVQSVDSINEYFKQIYKLLLEDDSIFNIYKKHYEKAKGALKSFISRIRGISTDGIEIDPEERVDYYSECKTLLKTLPNNFKTLLLLIDEFPDAVRNISNDSKKEGIRFLQTIRDLRQELNNINLQFVYSGSIGLGNVVNKLGRLDLITDIVNIELPPLNRKEAMELITRLVLGLKEERKDFEIGDQVKNYILEKDSWLIPYYIQIIVDELFDLFNETNKKLTESTVDGVIDKIIRDRYKYQDYFENWKTRLKQALERKEYNCALEILNYISTNGSMDYDAIYNLSVKYGIDDLKDITNVLEYDGYINKNLEKIYMFNSIILKEWWCINVAN
ncbi:MAG: hypothetical protein ACUZ8E_02420 [Candidatus Anammoxibacter sp.]